jgi:alginate O-acetyltransferase complex protein AlgI
VIFSSYEFIFIFFPLTFGGYFLLNRLNLSSVAKWYLVAASFVFYWYGAQWFVFGFAASVLWNYMFGVLLGRMHETGRPMLRRRLVMTLGILGNVGLLGYYKYTDFMIQNVNFLAGTFIPLTHIVLPIGISFFTFQLIAYLVDSYRGSTTNYRFVDYLLFITFFPQLIVGPIVHHGDMVPQFADKERQRLNWDNLALGLFLFVIGSAKKLLLADPMTNWAQAGFDHVGKMNFYSAWLDSFLYTISYYFDLSAYADMAIGLGLCFNIKLAINFDSPYKARNFADYWRRWHMTLSKFLGDYIFRSIYKHGAGSQRFYFAVFMTFLVSGFWHGAGWNFVIWGIFNGLFVMAAHFMTRHKLALPHFLAWFLTFLGAILLRILFVSTNLSDAFVVYGHMLNPEYSSIGSFIRATLKFGRSHYKEILYGIMGFAICVGLPNTNQIREKFRPSLKWGIVLVGLMLVCYLAMNKPADFLYFQF